jgi:hypothetical protein
MDNSEDYRLIELRKELLEIWELNLKSKGVKYPQGTAQELELLCLYEHIGNAISHDQISEWIKEHGGDYKRQARHLATKGWRISSGKSTFKRGIYDKSLNSNEYKLVSVLEVNPIEREEKQYDILIGKRYDSTLEEIHQLWEKNLAEHQMKFFTNRAVLGPIALVALYHNLGKPVTQEELEKWYIAHGRSYKGQARHLAAAGWHVVTGDSRGDHFDKNLDRNELMLISIEKPNPIWLTMLKVKRDLKASENSWGDRLELFKQRGCAVCGRIKEKYDRGHLDNTKDSSINNIVPMCASCNNWAGRYGLSFKMLDGTLVARPDLKSWVK